MIQILSIFADFGQCYYLKDTASTFGKNLPPKSDHTFFFCSQKESVKTCPTLVEKRPAADDIFPENLFAPRSQSEPLRSPIAPPARAPIDFLTGKISKAAPPRIGESSHFCAARINSQNAFHSLICISRFWID
jgi:hypothetical protein